MASKKTSYTLVLSALGVFVAFSSLAQDCSVANRGATFSPAFIKLVPRNWPNNAVVQAAQMWNNSCNAASGTIPEFWTNQAINPPGSFAIVNVDWNTGISPTLDVCGTFSGVVATVYQ